MYSKNSSLTSLLWCLIFFFCFATYFVFLSQKLPVDAGPDENAHTKAADFIYKNHRLPVYPQDKEEIHYSIFGATRSFRPPLVYITSAYVRSLLEKVDIHPSLPFRVGSALLGAFTALFLLLAIYTLTQRFNLAVALSSSFMLMPQVSFIYSYLNSDGAAIMSSAFILFCIARLIKKTNTLNLLLFGLSCGVLSLCKVTAWIFCFPVCVFAIFLIVNSTKQIIRPALIVFFCFVIVGGWRIAFNMYHHGLDNPFNWRLDTQINQIYARVDLDKINNYKSQGKSYSDLLANYDNFLSRTALSLIGHLDWLRIKVGPLQYAFYGITIGASLILSIWALFSFLIRKPKKPEYYFHLSIVFGTGFLFFMYMNFNINNDIQTQGKYLLPAAIGLVLLLASFLKFSVKNHYNQLACTILMALVIYIHFQGLYKYVLPYYYSNIFVDANLDRYTEIPNYEPDKTIITDLELIKDAAKPNTYRVTGPDPGMLISDVNVNTKSMFIVLRIDITSSRSDYYEVYWDAGSGMSEETMSRGFLTKGDSILYKILPTSVMHHIRFDFGIPSPETTFTINKLAYSSFRYKPHIRILNKLFNVNPLTHQI